MGTSETASKFNWDSWPMRFVGGLFMERKGDIWAISVGRVSWWLAFSPAIYIWVESMGTKDIADHHLTVLLLLATYNMGKKGLEILNKKITNDNGPG